jgi:hypothetical protein
MRSNVPATVEEQYAFQEYRNKVNLETVRYELTKLDNFDKRGPKGSKCSVPLSCLKESIEKYKNVNKI